MIYLIGGAPRCGKTILSRKLAKKRGVSWISTDSLQTMVQAYLPAREVRKKFPFSRIPGSEAISAEESLKAEIMESKSLWPGLKSFVIHSIQCHQDVVIEGVHLLPQLVNQFRGTEYWKHLKIIYLVKKDETLIADGLVKNTEKHDWLRPSLGKPKVVAHIAKMIALKSEYISKMATRYGFKVVNTEKDFKKTIHRYTKNSL